MLLEKNSRKLFEEYMNGLCIESLESIESIFDGKKSWSWEYEDQKYKASVIKLKDSSYDFMFGADRNGQIITGDTHAGNPLRAFAGALDALKQFIDKFKPTKFQYCGFKGRERLYDKFSKRIEKEFNYQLIDKYKEEWIIYYIFEK